MRREAEQQAKYQATRGAKRGATLPTEGAKLSTSDELPISDAARAEEAAIQAFRNSRVAPLLARVRASTAGAPGAPGAPAGAAGAPAGGATRLVTLRCAGGEP